MTCEGAEQLFFSELGHLFNLDKNDASGFSANVKNCMMVLRYNNYQGWHIH